MRLFYYRGILKDLGVSDPGVYGFDTFQLKNINSKTTFASIQADINTMDGYFTGEEDFVLSFTPIGDTHMGPSGGEGVASITRDPWYDNADAAFYSKMEALFDLGGYGLRGPFQGYALESRAQAPAVCRGVKVGCLRRGERFHGLQQREKLLPIPVEHLSF